MALSNHMRSNSRSARLLLVAGCVLLVFASGVLLLRQPWAPDVRVSPGLATQQWTWPEDHQNAEGQRPENAPRYLHFLIPEAAGADADVCKTLYSASALGYPAPVMVNWEWGVYDAHTSMLGGLDYFRTLRSEFNDDLVLFIDPRNVWLQLRPSVLIERYHQLIERANERLVRQYGNQHAGIEQSIIFAADKECGPVASSSPACQVVPNSTLPVENSPPDRDGAPTTDELESRHDSRPRFLNSGFIIGKVSAVRELFDRAVKYGAVNAYDNQFQGLLAENFGNQEVQRMALLSEVEIDEAADEAGSRDIYVDRPFEFGIGLDYGSSLVHSTNYADSDGEWRKGGGSRQPVTDSATESSLPDDVLESTGPFAYLVNAAKDVRTTSWRDVPLYTNKRTGVAPVAILHKSGKPPSDAEEAKAAPEKDRAESWTKMWFFSRLRDLLTAEAQSPLRPLTIIDDASSSNSAQQASVNKYWGYGFDRAGIYRLREMLEYRSLQEVCRGTDVELLRDDKGPWLDPNEEHRTFPP